MWVFGYGSLIWHPGFPVAEQRIARATGWHRSFCMRSIHHRGTEAAPGLVLALDAAPGAHCDGVAFRVAPGAEAETLAELRARELVSSAYLETRLPVMAGDQPLDCLAYVIDPDHGQYCGGLALEEQAQIIAQATGGRGPNRDYLWNTAAHLADLGIADPDLQWLSSRVRELTA
ncbi:MAG: gamma-glutamylcyclotransferase [Gemmobacter sp.]|uniref:gamma-glutamylcyclotransferase n=1 Tax=Gemmobacter sp. TaxID=1898957 RepID=UPI001A5A9119|nr:gamma-glutamylcyclotransferase [Gemmobacter sp.]MBL8562008.1 gamma-glutamylcyclotransferase [Gemmobacter sp.]